jgi:predicted ester cyclase
MQMETDMQSQMTADQRIALHRETIDEHMRAENAHEWPAVYDTFIQDERAYYDVVPLSSKFDGFKGVVDFYEIFDKAVPDFHITVTGECDSPGMSVREVTITGTHRGEYCGVEPTGEKVSFEMAAFYIFGEGKEAHKLLAERIYFDNETLLKQMRGEANAPIGVGLAKDIVELETA